MNMFKVNNNNKDTRITSLTSSDNCIVNFEQISPCLDHISNHTSKNSILDRNFKFLERLLLLAAGFYGKAIKKAKKSAEKQTSEKWQQNSSFLHF